MIIKLGFTSLLVDITTLVGRLNSLTLNRGDGIQFMPPKYLIKQSDESSDVSMHYTMNSANNIVNKHLNSAIVRNITVISPDWRS